MSIANKIIIPLSHFTHLFTKQNAYQDEYNLHANRYDHAITRPRFSQITHEFIQNIPFSNPLNVLDLGCGTGDALLQLSKRLPQTCDISGCDISESMLNIARVKLQPVRAVQFFCADMLCYLKSLPDCSCDLISCCWALGYSRPRMIMRQIARVLRPKGIVAVLVNTQHSLSNLQQCVTRLILQRPFILKQIPPIYFPAHVREFTQMLQGLNLKHLQLAEKSFAHTFDSTEQLVDWVKTSGPCAGLREAIKEKHREQTFALLQDRLRKKGTLKIYFHFIPYVGEKE